MISPIILDYTWNMDQLGLQQRYHDEDTGDDMYTPVYHSSRIFPATEERFGKVEVTIRQPIGMNNIY